MKIAFLMDPLENVKPEKDTTYILMLAACREGHKVYYIPKDSLSYCEENVFANCHNLQVSDHRAEPFTVDSSEKKMISEFDCIWIRTDPPFDRRYFYNTLLLDLASKNTFIVNHPRALRDWNEKLSALFFPKITPPTLVTSNKEEIIGFMRKFNKVVAKPIDGHGGRGIEFLLSTGTGQDELIEKVTHGGRRKVVVQTFVPEAEQGDKRILIVDGEPIGAILRRAGGESQLNNLDQGGTAYSTELTKKDREICELIKPELRKSELFFVGIDLLGEMLTEINVTSPTGLQELIRFSGVEHHINTIRTLEKRVKNLHDK